MLRTLAVTAIAFWLVGPSNGWARKVEFWPYDRLSQESELIVIATAMRSELCDEAWPEDDFSKDRFVGTETVFKVESVLKGGTPDSVRVIHFSYKQGATRYDNGPGFVTFLTEPIVTAAKKAGHDSGVLKEWVAVVERLANKPEYLLFLKKRSDGRYEAVSGQMDSALSVRTISPPDETRRK
ncbi:MAG: hypothetical protein VYA84_07435 [Planctomycetota bacterium]|nr:hypothetical protein [Planctomycetota bacterium]